MRDRMSMPLKRQKATALPTAQNELLQRSSTLPQQATEVPPIVHEVLSSSGQPLDTATQAFMEPRFGHDFSQVRIHTDERAVQSAQEVNARAYTVGQDIAFGAVQYAPETMSGKMLLAHELTHVVQQGGGRNHAETLALDHPHSTAEGEAQAAAGAVVADQPMPQTVSTQAEATVQRSVLGEIVGGVGGAIVGAVAGGLVAGPLGAVLGGVAGAVGGAAIGESLTSGGPASASASGTAAAAPEMRVVHTAHGTFNVYPDDFTGPLPVADYATQGWPVRQSMYNRLETAINAISGGTAKVTLGGDNAFKTSVLSDLAWLMTQDVGLNLLQAITGSGKNLTIDPTTGGNSTSYAPDADSFEQPDGTPGPGASVTVNYNTAEWNPYGGVDDWMRRPPAIGLAHELVHAWTGMIGTRALGETGGVRRRELQATGLGEFSAAAYTENQFRQAFGLPLRPHY